MTTAPAAPLLASPDPRDPEDRLSRFFDPGSLELLASRDTSGVLAARGRVSGSPAIAFCTDATVMGGAMGVDGCRHIVDAIDTALRERVPVVGIWHSGGARLAEGVTALHAVGEVFAAMVRSSGRIPQISVVLGAAAGGAAYGPALTDIVIMGPAGRVFVTGPDVVRSVTGENVDQETLGGPDTHGRRSGVVHVVTDSEPAALETARQAVDLLALTKLTPLFKDGGGDRPVAGGECFRKLESTIVRGLERTNGPLGVLAGSQWAGAVL